jgi:hypothetical protein
MQHVSNTEYSVRIFVEYTLKMQRLEVSGAVRHIHMSLGGKGLFRSATSSLTSKVCPQCLFW